MPQGVEACTRCRCWTTFPIPTEAELDAAYADWYRPEGGRFSGPGDWLLRRTRGSLAGRIDAIAPAGPVLDIGSGDGSLLDALEARGREARGLERGQTGDARVERTDLSEIEPGWSAIVMWHSLEHLPEPGGAIDRAVELLAPGGVIVVAVPNPASLQARLFGARWLALDLPRHLVHIPASELTARLERAGAGVERVSYLRGGQVLFGWLHGLVGSLPGQMSLYDAIRQERARSEPMTTGRRLATLASGAALLPLAALLTLAEAALRRGGTTYVEARRV